MIGLIIWSKDRLCQLYSLLESIHRNTQHLLEIVVIYSSSNDEVSAKYQQVCETFDVAFFSELDDLRTCTLEAINYLSSTDHIAFCTDKQIFYRPLQVSYDMVQEFLPQHNNETFSLRLGYNTIVQDVYQRINQVPLFNEEKLDSVEPVLKWDVSFYHPSYNYGYPLALDTHVYTKEYAQYLIEEIREWSIPNQLEGAMQVHRHSINYMSCFMQSVSVNVFSGDLPQSNRGFLQEQFDKGKKIDIEAIMAKKIVGCHQIIPYQFKDR